MIEILQTAFNKKILISFCIGKINWEKRIIGYVKSVNTKKVLVDEVDIYGSVFKSETIVIDKIAIIEMNDDYNKHLEKLKEQGKMIKKVKSLYYYNRSDMFREKIEILRLNGNVCTIFFGTQYKTGVIKKISKNIISINAIGYRGTEDGESYCTLESITAIRYQGPLEEKIRYLKNKL